MAVDEKQLTEDILPLLLPTCVAACNAAAAVRTVKLRLKWICCPTA